MNFGDAINLVTGITKRPDKVVDIKAAINKALEVYVKAANWAVDLVELTVVINPNLYAQSFLITTELATFRKIKYIRPTNATKYLTFVPPDKVFQPDGCEQINVYYRAGQRIVFKLSALNPSLEIGYYRYYPYLVNNADTHWMLDIIPSMITDKAISEIWDSIGADAEAKRYLGYAAQQFLVNEADLADGADRYNA
jgi:hypothetical protein